MNRFVLIGSATLLLTMISPASAEPNCASFMFNADGSWSPTHPYMFATPTYQTQLMPSEKMLPQMSGAAGRLVRYLNARCRSERSMVGAGVFRECHRKMPTRDHSHDDDRYTEWWKN